MELPKKALKKRRKIEQKIAPKKSKIRGGEEEKQEMNAIMDEIGTEKDTTMDHKSKDSLGSNTTRLYRDWKWVTEAKKKGKKEA